MVVAIGAAMLLAGCNDSPDNAKSAMSNAKVASATVTTTSAGGGKSSGGGIPDTAGESPDIAGGITTGAPVPGHMTKAPSELWDPCGISDADMTKLGFGASSKKVLTGSGDNKSCSWQSLVGKSDVVIEMNREEMRSYQNNPRYLEYSPVTVGGWAGAQFRAAQDGKKIGCYVAISVPTGSAIFVTRNLGVVSEEPCAQARRIAEGLVGYLPS